MKFNNKFYDLLKWIALVVLPALATLYGSLAPTWGWPYGDEIVYTITAVDCFLGALLGISSLNYHLDKKEGISDDEDLG